MEYCNVVVVVFLFKCTIIYTYECISNNKPHFCVQYILKLIHLLPLYTRKNKKRQINKRQYRYKQIIIGFKVIFSLIGLFNSVNTSLNCSQYRLLSFYSVYFTSLHTFISFFFFNFRPIFWF